MFHEEADVNIFIQEFSFFVLLTISSICNSTKKKKKKKRLKEVLNVIQFETSQQRNRGTGAEFNVSQLIDIIRGIEYC